MHAPSRCKSGRSHTSGRVCRVAWHPCGSAASTATHAAAAATVAVTPPVLASAIPYRPRLPIHHQSGGMHGEVRPRKAAELLIGGRASWRMGRRTCTLGVDVRRLLSLAQMPALLLFFFSLPIAATSQGSHGFHRQGEGRGGAASGEGGLEAPPTAARPAPACSGPPWHLSPSPIVSDRLRAGLAGRGGRPHAAPHH